MVAISKNVLLALVPIVFLASPSEAIVERARRTQDIDEAELKEAEKAAAERATADKAAAVNLAAEKEAEAIRLANAKKFGDQIENLVRTEVGYKREQPTSNDNARNEDILLTDNMTEVNSPQWHFWKKPVGQKRALLIIVGLLRSLGEFYPKLHKNFIIPNEEAGYDMQVALSTSLHANCSEKNIANRQQEWCNNVMLRYGKTKEEKELYVSKRFRRWGRFIDSADVCHSKAGEASPGMHATTDYLGGRWRAAGCSGTVHFASRAVQMMDQYKGMHGFDKVIIVRTDNCFELKGHAKEDKPVLLDEACKTHKGVNIVGNLNTIPGFYHGDYDHAWLLCDGNRAAAFRRAVAAFGLDCGSECTAETRPPCPAGFCPPGERLPCGHNMCLSAKTLHEAGVPFGTLDDYMVANYQKFTDTHGTVQLLRSLLPDGLEPFDNVDDVPHPL